MSSSTASNEDDERLLEQKIAALRHQRRRIRAASQNNDQAHQALEWARHERDQALQDWWSAQRDRQRLEHRLDLAQQWQSLNDVLHIWFQGPYATINGLRIGADVPWPEINAALGQVVLLLQVLIERTGVKVSQQQILPRGSTSQIGSNLYFGESFQFFARRSFYFGLQALAQSIHEVAVQMQQQDPSLALPHAMDQRLNEYHVGGLAIAYHEGPEWTRAMKYLLTNLKQLLLFKGLLVQQQQRSSTT